MPRENRFLSQFRPQGREFWIVKREKGNGKRKKEKGKLLSNG